MILVAVEIRVVGIFSPSVILLAIAIASLQRNGNIPRKMNR